jgi:hypothetical protein
MLVTSFSLANASPAGSNRSGEPLWQSLRPSDWMGRSFLRCHSINGEIFGRSKDLYCQEECGQAIIVFVAMEIMSAHLSRFSRIGAITCGIVLATGLQLFAQQSPAYSRNLARFSSGARIDDNLAQVALISDQSTVGYALLQGTCELVLSLSKIENFDVIVFANRDGVGTVSVSTSNSKLATGSPQWHQVTRLSLTPNVTKIKVGPTEAKYVKFTFKVTKSGRIADLGVYCTAMPNLTVANTALAGAQVDGKDFKDSKEAKEVAEGPPAEEPAPALPDAPPFVFVPEISP